mgnify:CR=1 FL=1
MNLPEIFRRYLKNQNLSSLTVKNYVADVKNFLSWLNQKYHINYRLTDQSFFHLLTAETIEQYKKDLLSQKTPLSTLNRRLSTLRKFGQFAQSQGWLVKNPASTVENVQISETNILAAFGGYLEKEKVSSATLKNYLSDLRHFINWVEILP